MTDQLRAAATPPPCRPCPGCGRSVQAGSDGCLIEHVSIDRTGRCEGSGVSSPAPADRPKAGRWT